MNFKTKNTFIVTVTGEQRTGFCEQCGTKTEKEFYMDGKRKRVRMACPECGGQGELIAKTYAIQAPKAPKEASLKELWRFIKDVEYHDLLSAYHKERVKYATHRRHKKIKEKYRTGEPSPKNIKETLKAIAQLRIDKLRRC